MGLNAKKAKGGQGGGNRVKQPNLEPGGYPARLVQVIDMGLQAQKPYQGKDKPPVQMINLTYELLDEFMIDEEGKILEDKPRWMGETIPLYNLKAEKAKSTQRYYALDPKEAADGDFTELVGSPVTVNVVNNKSGDNVYDNVESLSAMRPKEAAKAPELINDSKVFLLDEPDVEVFRSLPEFIQEKIMANLEYEGSALEALIKGGKAEKPAAEEEQQDEDNEPEEGDEDGDDTNDKW